LVKALRSVLPPEQFEPKSDAVRVPGEVDAARAAQALWGHRDFIWLEGPGPAQLSVDAAAHLSVSGGVALVSGPCGEVRLEARGFDLLEAALEAWGGAGDARLMGFLGYELGCELEDVAHRPPGAFDPPDLQLGLYDWRLVRGAAGWQLCGTNAWREAPEALRHPAQTAGGCVGLPSQREVVSAPDAAGFCDAVSRTVARIYRGELFQVNLCRRLEAPLATDEILPLYLRLRAISPASHGALMRTVTGAILSASPESFLSLRDGWVRSCPIKGTRPRGATPEEDRALAAALAASEKDRAELAMIVDVVRNDLGRVCRSGSVKVARHAAPMELPTVHHTFSEVTGQLRPECGAADLLRASFPPASISGAPKIHAMEVAAIEEPFRRGPAMGSIGWIGLNGDLELSVAIRTAVAAEGRAWYLAGCGITADSVPEEELAESEAKAAAFLRALA
jgi:para-aminobenzoate synthetase component 1